MGKVIKLSDIEVAESKESYVRVSNIYMKEYFSLPLFTTSKVEHGKNIFDIALMFKYWEKTDCVKSNKSSLAELIGIDRRTIDKYINSDLEAHEYAKQCQVCEISEVGRNIIFKIENKPIKQYYTAVPMEILSSKELTPLEKKVYMVVLFYSNNDDGIAWVSRAVIAELCGCEKSSVSNAVKRLEKAKVLSYVTVRKTNGQSKNFYKPLLVVKNNHAIRLNSEIYVSPSIVNKAIGVLVAIGEKEKEQEIEPLEQLPEKNNKTDLEEIEEVF